MSQSLHDKIANFEKMAAEDPENELGHFRLGQLYAEADDTDKAVASFRRTLELSPQFSKVYQLLGETLAKAGRTEEAIATLTEGYDIARERGDRMPADAIKLQLIKLGAPPADAQPAVSTEDVGPDTGFRCKRPGCMEGSRARELPFAPIPGPLGERIRREVCSGCWTSWFKDYSIKVINELRLDLSTENGQSEYDKHMTGYMGFDDVAEVEIDPVRGGNPGGVA